jgi:hypothetical protein
MQNKKVEESVPEKLDGRKMMGFEDAGDDVELQQILK